MIRKLLFLLCIVLLQAGANAQYYFNDVWQPTLTQQYTQKLFALKVATVTATSKDVASGNTITIQQRIDPAKKTVTTLTQNGSNQSITRSFYGQTGKLVKQTDSSLYNTVTTYYSYNADNQLDLLKNEVYDAAVQQKDVEEHKWFYRNNLPVGMVKVKNGSDTSEVKFDTDENQQVAQETWVKKGRMQETYYYYYAQNSSLLTDIVRYNNKAKKLLPDFLYEYNAAGQLVQTTQVLTGSNNYFVWKYSYQENGLKLKEECFDKQGLLVGYVTYSYTF